MSQTNIQTNTHAPVLIDSVLEFLPKKTGFIFDGTFGGGGYSKEFLKRDWTVYSSDLDDLAIAEGKKLALEYSTFTIIKGAFDTALETFDDRRFQAIVADLGYSSNQLEYSGRGFSYQKREEILDLRYDDNKGDPVWKKIVKIKDPKELGKILYRYSGERMSMKIGDRICSIVEPDLKVGAVVDVIDNALAPQDKRHKNKILSRVWQSLRIWVNDEHEHLSNFLPMALNKLDKGGRLIIVNFHSLEDKLVAQFMRTAARPVEVDDYGNKEQYYKLLTKKPVVPTEEEIEKNIRSRSARMRVLEKL